MFDEEGYGSESSGGAHDRLAARMRAVKERSGLSYGRLAGKTHYSRSSWERFLNGKQLPSRVAVEEFAAAVGEDEEPLIALLDEVLSGERADLASGRGPAQGPGSDAEIAAAPGPAAPGATAVLVPAPESVVSSPPRAAAQEEPGFWRRKAAAWLPAGRALGYVTLGALLGTVASVLILAPAGAGQGGDKGGSAARPSASAGAGQSTSAAGTIKVGCSSDTCLRREPQAMDCQWDATTVRQTWLRGLQIELRYSAACQAVWGRIEGGTIDDSVTIKDHGGNELTAQIRVEHDTYTRMLAVAADRPWQEVTICGTIPRFHERECSPRGAVQP